MQNENFSQWTGKCVVVTVEVEKIIIMTSFSDIASKNCAAFINVA